METATTCALPSAPWPSLPSALPGLCAPPPPPPSPARRRLALVAPPRPRPPDSMPCPWSKTPPRPSRPTALLSPQSMLSLAPKLTNKTLVNGVLKHLSKLQARSARHMHPRRAYRGVRD